MNPDEDPPFQELTRPTVFLSEKLDWKFLRRSRLVVTRGADQGLELVVEKERVTLGRSSACDLVLTDASVSGLHCEIVCKPDGCLVRDLDSTNGIFIQGNRVGELHLRPGVEFQVGKDAIRFESLDSVVKIPLSERGRFGSALGRSVRMREVFALLEKVSNSNLPVLLRGETGTGKELLASAVHANSRRKKRPFVVLDCGAISSDLIESTLFGHEKGAFTGAVEVHRGVFEQAHGGTLFIDEVEELTLALQPKLLRALEQGEVQRVGGMEPIQVDVRIVAASRSDLLALVDKGLFREDLYYRFSVVEAVISPLRERVEDIPLLVEHFMREGVRLRKQHGLGAVRIEDEAVRTLQSHAWPGNVRELRNTIERAVLLAEGETIGSQDLQPFELGRGDRQVLALDCSLPFKQAKSIVMRQFERQYLLQLLKEHGGNLSAASRKAKLSRFYLRNLCTKYGISR